MQKLNCKVNKVHKAKGRKHVHKRQAEEMAHTCSGGLLKAGETDMPEPKPDPDKMSFNMPLIPRRSRDFAPSGEPLAHVERSRINPCKKVESYCRPLKQ